MNTFRTLSERRSFISLSLLLLLISTFTPICHAETGTAGVDHHLNNSSSDDRYAGEFGHTDGTPDHCCSDLTAQANILPLALVSSAGLDLGDVLSDVEPLIPVPHNSKRISAGHSFHFRPPGLPVYLHTQRLRI